MTLRAILLLVLLAFAGVARAADKPDSCAYLAGLVAPDGPPLFLPSYPAAEPGALRNTAYLYDNAAAAIALVGCGEARRAGRIGDAMLWALDHDRAWHDGRLRNAYAAGIVADNPVKLGGWWDGARDQWNEDRYQVGSDSGNMAWAMLALLTLGEGNDGKRYREAAGRIGDFLARRLDTRGAGGFIGGFIGWEPKPDALLWKSTEHNIDLGAAFARLGAVTGNRLWAERAATARYFVEAMWDAGERRFATGTGDDGVTRSLMLVLDANIWPLLAFPEISHGGEALKTVARLKEGDGYTYSEAGHGLWTEGTAQAALLAKLQGRTADAQRLMAAIEKMRTPDGAYLATDAATLQTGFGDIANRGQSRVYYRQLHLAAAAWAALAERGFNPFTGRAALP